MTYVDEVLFALIVVGCFIVGPIFSHINSEKRIRESQQRHERELLRKRLTESETGFREPRHSQEIQACNDIRSSDSQAPAQDAERYNDSESTGSAARPKSPVTREVPGALDEQVAGSRRVPEHLDWFWQPARRYNEKAETSIRKLWEHHSRHELTTTRRREFLRRPEVAALAKLVENEYDVVVRAAREEAGGHPQGHLLLDRWLDAAEEELARAARAEEHRTASQREAEKARAEIARIAAVSIAKCDSCGRGIGPNGECGCS